MLLSLEYREAAARLALRHLSLPNFQRPASKVVSVALPQGQPSGHEQPSDQPVGPPEPKPPEQALAPSNAANHSVAELDLHTTCDICMDARKTEAFIPCGHMLACESCALKIIRSTGLCPACSQVVSSTMRVYVT